MAQNKDKAALVSYLDQHTPEYSTVAKTIWGFAEVGYQEQKSSALLQETLQKEGFTVKAGIAGIQLLSSPVMAVGNLSSVSLPNMMHCRVYRKQMNRYRKLLRMAVQDMVVVITCLVQHLWQLASV
jgi:sugar diacid utilization regulator